jgi:hypothetical protein
MPPNGQARNKLDGEALGEQALRAMSASTASGFQSVSAPVVVVGLISVLGLLIGSGAAAD